MKLLFLFGILFSIGSGFNLLKKVFTKNKVINFENYFLKNEFEPVLEEKTIIVENKCSKMKKLKGFFGQVGSNPKFISEDDQYHWFDGNGMIHGVFFNETNIVYKNHWIRTTRYNIEDYFKRKIYLYLGELKGLKGMMKILASEVLFALEIIPKVQGRANTALLNWNNKTYSLQEGDLPYEIDIDLKNKDISTVGQLKLENITSVTAHPEIDLLTNKLYLYGYNTDDLSKGIFYNNVFDNKFNLLKRRNYSMINNCMIHDISQSENYIIIPDLPLNFDIKNIIENKLPLQFNNNSLSRIGLLDKSSDHLEWFIFEKNFFIFHFVKSFEKDDKVIIFACVFDEVHMEDFVDLNDNKYVRGNPSIKKIIIDKKSKKTEILENVFLSDRSVLGFPYYIEFPIKSGDGKTLYGSVFDRDTAKIKGIVRVEIDDFELSIPNFMILEDKFICSEPYVVNIDEKEYLLGFTYDKNTSYISLLDIDNKKSHNINLNTRIPPGFHTIMLNN